MATAPAQAQANEDAPIIGIDVGTSSLRVALWPSQQTHELPCCIAAAPNLEGQDGPAMALLVGGPARDQAIMGAAHTAWALPRLLAQAHTDELALYEAARASCQHTQNDRGDAWLNLDGTALSPEEGLAKLLRAGRDWAAQKLGKPVAAAVFTLPMAYGSDQRRALHSAARIAGLPVKQILQGPIAAALTTGMQKVQQLEAAAKPAAAATQAPVNVPDDTPPSSPVEMPAGDPPEEVVPADDPGSASPPVSEPEMPAPKVGDSQAKTQHILVVNFGAGTLEAGLVALSDESIDLLADASNTMLGGHDCDEALVAHLAADFHATHSVDLRQDPVAHERLREAVQAARERLSDAPHTQIVLPHLAATRDGTLTLQRRLDRAFVLEAIVDHLASGAALCREVLAQAQVSPEALDAVWSLGGMRHTPGWAAALAALSPAPVVDCDAAPVLGAARLGAMLHGTATGPKIHLATNFAATEPSQGPKPGLNRDEVDAIIARDRAAQDELARREAHLALMARARTLLLGLAQAREAEPTEAQDDNPNPAPRTVLGDDDGSIASAAVEGDEDYDGDNAVDGPDVDAGQNLGAPPLVASMMAVQQALAGDISSPEAHAHLAQTLQTLDIAAARRPGRGARG